MKTQSTPHAMAVLKAFRSQQIATGIAVSWLITGLPPGWVHSRQMTDYMRDHKLLDLRFKKFWAGAVYYHSPYFKFMDKANPSITSGEPSHGPRDIVRWLRRPGATYADADLKEVLLLQRAVLMNGTGIPPFLAKFQAWSDQSMVEIVMRRVTPHQSDDGKWWRVSLDEEITDADLAAEKQRSGVDWAELLNELATIKSRTETKAIIEAVRVVTKFVARNYL